MSLKTLFSRNREVQEGLAALTQAVYDLRATLVEVNGAPMESLTVKLAAVETDNLSLRQQLADLHSVVERRHRSAETREQRARQKAEQGEEHEELEFDPAQLDFTQPVAPQRGARRRRRRR